MDKFSDDVLSDIGPAGVGADVGGVPPPPPPPPLELHAGSASIKTAAQAPVQVEARSTVIPLLVATKVLWVASLRYWPPRRLPHRHFGLKVWQKR